MLKLSVALVVLAVVNCILDREYYEYLGMLDLTSRHTCKCHARHD